jgi:Lon protease-like protein
VNPVHYAQRLEEAIAEKSAWSTLLPIFYYNEAMFPGSKLGLHLFEPRYRVMMQRVVDSTRSFAYVPNFNNYTAKVGDVALIAQLEEVEFMSDGRCMLEAKLTSRHIIVDHFGEYT